MGNSSSTVASCLTEAVGAENVAFPTNNPLYQVADVRPYNLDVPVSPVAVTYPKSAEDVAAVIKCAAQNKLTVQARSGGHSYANYGLGGGDANTVVVDLKNFQQFSMDNNTWEARIGAGTLLGDVTSKLLAAGNRAMAHGTCPQVGIGGHATIGGLGPPSRMWGSALDHVLEVTVVLANSSIVTASPTSYPDVFFALKGAGAGFGVITEFKVRTQPAPGEIITYNYVLSARPFTGLAKRFKDWQTLVSDPQLSRKFASQCILSEVGMIVSGTFFGSKAEFDALNLTSVFPDATDSSQVVINDWAGAVGHWAEDVVLQISGAIPSAFYSKTLTFTEGNPIPDSGVDALFQYLETADKGTPLWFVIFDLAGGAVNDVPLSETAYAHRDALFYLQTYAINVPNVSNTTKAFLGGINDKIVSDMEQDKLGGFYPGYVDPALPESAAQQGYWRDNLQRLMAIKKAVDPDDVFHNPQSVRPAK